MRPILHIGLHKTGTTFLQRNVFFDASLGYQQVWSFGEIVENVVLTHPMRFDASALRAAFDRARNDGRVPVVSHEALSGVPSEGRYHGFMAADRLRAIFPDARVIIGVREQHSMIRSLYDEYITRGGDKTLADFLGVDLVRKGFRPLCQMEHFEYDLLVGYYQTLFGAESVLTMPIEYLARDQRAYLDRLSDFTGVSLTQVGALPRRNVGRGAATLEIERRLNPFVRISRGKFDSYDSYPWPYRLKNRVLRLAEKTLPKSAHARREQALRGLIAEVAGDRFVESNRRLAAMTGLDLAALGYRT